MKLQSNRFNTGNNLSNYIYIYLNNNVLYEL